MCNFGPPEPLTSQRRPRYERHGNPNKVCISIQRPALQQIGTFTSEPLEHSPKTQRNEQCVSINQPRRSAQKPEVIRKVLFARARQILADSASQEQDHHDRCCDPEGAVEVRVAFKDIEEVLARIERGAAAGEDLGCVDVEELLVEVYAPEEPFGGGLLVAWTGAEEGG